MSDDRTHVLEVNVLFGGAVWCGCTYAHACHVPHLTHCTWCTPCSCRPKRTFHSHIHWCNNQSGLPCPHVQHALRPLPPLSSTQVSKAAIIAGL